MKTNRPGEFELSQPEILSACEDRFRATCSMALTSARLTLSLRIIQHGEARVLQEGEALALRIEVEGGEQ